MLLGYADIQMLLPYQMHWFTVFPYLLATLLCVPRLPRLLCFGVAAANLYFCCLYVYALGRLALGLDPDSVSPLWSLIVFGAGTTALNLSLALNFGLHARTSAPRAASVKAA